MRHFTRKQLQSVMTTKPVDYHLYASRQTCKEAKPGSCISVSSMFSNDIAHIP